MQLRYKRLLGVEAHKKRKKNKITGLMKTEDGGWDMHLHFKDSRWEGRKNSKMVRRVRNTRNLFELNLWLHLFQQ